ncbi:MAG: hypothetical protein WC214_05685 [Candidatus Omnitrophota bacterium]|jgi:hypothetical protein
MKMGVKPKRGKPIFIYPDPEVRKLLDDTLEKVGMTIQGMFKPVLRDRIIEIRKTFGLPEELESNFGEE